MVPCVAGRTDGPCDPRAPRRSKASGWGPGLSVPSRSQGLPWVVSTIRPNAGPCREGGLSSTDERVRGHATEVTQALSKSSKWSPRHPHTYNRDDLNTSCVADLDSTCWTCFMSATASAKHENFVMSILHTQRERGGARPPDRLYSCTWSIWAVSKLPARPRGRWTLSPSLPPMALTARSYRSRRLYQPPLATAKAISIPRRQTRASSSARDAHGVMPNSRHVPSREQRSTSRENALCKGFETIMT